MYLLGACISREHAYLVAAYLLWECLSQAYIHRRASMRAIGGVDVLPSFLTLPIAESRCRRVYISRIGDIPCFLMLASLTAVAMADGCILTQNLRSGVGGVRHRKRRAEAAKFGGHFTQMFILPLYVAVG